MDKNLYKRNKGDIRGNKMKKRILTLESLRKEINEKYKILGQSRMEQEVMLSNTNKEIYRIEGESRLLKRLEDAMKEGE